MRKILSSMILFFGMFSLVAQSWQKKVITDRWGDENGYFWLQANLGENDEDTCVFSILVRLPGAYPIGVVMRTEEEINPAHYILNEDKITLSFRNGSLIKKFDLRSYNDLPKVGNDTAIFFPKIAEDHVKILELLTEDNNWEVLVETKDWYVRSKLVGNLPVHFDKNDVLIISKDGKTLNRIKLWAKYSEKNSIESVVIPEGVEAIGEEAFSGCKSLKAVYLPKSLKEIEMDAFWGCENLTTISIPKGDSIEVIHKYAFSRCKSLETINLTNKNLEIFSGAFDNCKSLKNINSSKYHIVDNMYVVGNYKIVGFLDDDLKNYVFPKNISELPEVLPGKMENLVIQAPTKIENIDFESVTQWATELILIEFGRLKNLTLKSITVPKSVKLSNFPTSVQIIRK